MSDTALTETISDEIKTNGKIALVTGSSSGIGANIAIDLASNGYFIVITGRDELKLNKVVARCNEISKCSAISFQADLLDLKQVDKLIQFIKLKFKRLDVLVNNACWRGEYKNVLCNNDGDADHGSLAFDDFKQVMHINVSIPMYLVHQCVIAMRQQQQSNIIVVNISSIASHVVVPLHTYSISKACLSEMSHQLAELSQRWGIYSIAISPGPILTDERPHHKAMSNMTLMNRVGTTQEISDLVLFAMQNARLFNGQELNIDGGYIAKQRKVIVNDSGNGSNS